MNEKFRNHLQTILNTKILSIDLVHGGSISRAYKLSCMDSCYFIKTNERDRYPNIFEIESKSLRFLGEKSNFHIPKVIHTAHFEMQQYLLLEFFEVSKATQLSWRVFAESLAAMHQQSSEFFGFHFDNYIGSLEQSNSLQKNWIDFFITERLEKQIKLASDAQLIDQSFRQKMNRLYSSLDQILFLEKPALLHGDLWSGNVLTTPNGALGLIDPAIYYGHREIDIAMTKLFSGFPQLFYESYQECFPMENDWEKRLEIYQLYPLLVHLNLFGLSYLNQVKSIVMQFT